MVSDIFVQDLQREGPQPFKFAGIGGLSEFLGLVVCSLKLLAPGSSIM